MGLPLGRQFLVCFRWNKLQSINLEGIVKSSPRIGTIGFWDDWDCYELWNETVEWAAMRVVIFFGRTNIGSS
jgi:hypothetical protein